MHETGDGPASFFSHIDGREIVEGESTRENTCQLFENDREGSDGRKREKQRCKRDREKWRDEEG